MPPPQNLLVLPGDDQPVEKDTTRKCSLVVFFQSRILLWRIWTSCAVLDIDGSPFHKVSCFWRKAALKFMTSRASLLPTLCLISGCELLAHSLASNVVWWQCGNDTKGRIGNSFWSQKGQFPVLRFIPFLYHKHAF